MFVTHLQNSLFIVVLLGVTLCTFTFLIMHPDPSIRHYNPNENTAILNIDQKMVNNISQIVLKNILDDVNLQLSSKKSTLTMIYIITPTYKRPEQIPDLTRLAQTLMHVPAITWLVIEDSESLTISPQVSSILRNCGLRFIHMIAPMPKEQQKKKVKARGVSNRNKGLQWIRDNYVDAKAVIYFADDDNTYDLRLFKEIRSVQRIGMWPVGLVTNYGMSSPIVKNGSVTGFYDGWIGKRTFAVDMAGFAIAVDLLLKKPRAVMPFVPGYEEDGFLKSLGITLKDIEPKADNCTKIYVWHTQTKKNKPPSKLNETVHGETNIKELYKQIL